MALTNDQHEKLIQQVVAVLRNHAPPHGLTDQQGLRDFYSIFDGPACWKALPRGSAAKQPAEPNVQARSIRQMGGSRRSS